ncbi:MAG: hypothetical protein R2830_18620 [Saprospiraceae bacterium]
MYFPQLKRIENKEDLAIYSQTYETCSGLPVPMDYLANADNQVFAIYCKGEMAGGFVLGQHARTRTIEVFAQEAQRPQVYAQLEPNLVTTEICCFWMAPHFRRQTFFNFFTWLGLAYAVAKYGSSQLLFGTCSQGLARLYALSGKAVLLHRDHINGKSTYIFMGHSRFLFTSVLTILKSKLVRIFWAHSMKNAPLYPLRAVTHTGR